MICYMDHILLSIDIQQLEGKGVLDNWEIILGILILSVILATNTLHFMKISGTSHLLIYIKLREQR